MIGVTCKVSGYMVSKFVYSSMSIEMYLTWYMYMYMYVIVVLAYL
jgi:hypothetical protein